MTYEGFRLKVKGFIRKKFARFRKKAIDFSDFTIISNNCWGGMTYENYGLQKNSPTVGLFFMAGDYIKFISNLKEYLNTDFVFIKPEESQYVDYLKKDPKFMSYPIGKLKDIEVMFNHYQSEAEARKKWNRRCLRINWDKILVKFNDQNGCSIEHINTYSKLPYKNKLFFTVKDWPVQKWEGYYKIRQHVKKDSITASHEPIGDTHYFKITDLINNL